MKPYRTKRNNTTSGSIPSWRLFATYLRRLPTVACRCRTSIDRDRRLIYADLAYQRRLKPTAARAITLSDNYMSRLRLIDGEKSPQRTCPA